MKYLIFIAAFLISLNCLGYDPILPIEKGGTSSDQGVTSTAIVDGEVKTDDIADDNVTGAKLDSTIAGSGLTQDGSGNLDLNVDDSTVEISGDSLQVKDLGITLNKLAGNSVNGPKVVNGSIAGIDIANQTIDNANLGLQIIQMRNLESDRFSGSRFNTDWFIPNETASFVGEDSSASPIRGMQIGFPFRVLINTGSDKTIYNKSPSPPAGYASFSLLSGGSETWSSHIRGFVYDGTYWVEVFKVSP